MKHTAAEYEEMALAQVDLLVATAAGDLTSTTTYREALFAAELARTFADLGNAAATMEAAAMMARATTANLDPAVVRRIGGL